MIFLRYNGRAGLRAGNLARSVLHNMQHTKRKVVRIHFKWYDGVLPDYYDTQELLRLLMIPFSLGNDAPRVGRYGDYVRLMNSPVTVLTLSAYIRAGRY